MQNINSIIRNLNVLKNNTYRNSLSLRYGKTYSSKRLSHHIGQSSAVATKCKGHLKHIIQVAGSSICAAAALNYIWSDLASVEALGTNDLKWVLEKATTLYDQLSYEDLYNLLIKYKDCRSDEVLWRLARAIYEKCRLETNSTTKKELLRQALTFLEEANRLNPNSFAVHKWLAIIMDCYYTLEGTKARISHLYDMKNHMEKACELKPKDGTSWYVLGMWYFGIANIAWYERKAAELLFATPPKATFEDALKLFEEAERVEPGFYSMNYLMMAKCLYHLDRKEEAKLNFLKAKNNEGKTADDEQARDEAAKWLSGM